MEMKDFLDFFEENKSNTELKVLFKQLYTAEDVLRDPDYSKAIDARVTGAINTYKEKGFKAAVEEELKKKQLEGQKEPWQLEIEALKSELAKKEQENIRSSQKARALKVAAEKGLPSDILDYFLGASDEETDTKLGQLGKTFEEYTSKIKQEVLKSHNIGVPANGNKFTQETNKEIKLPANASKEQYKEAMAAQLAAERDK